jgi:hypothetical protein
MRIDMKLLKVLQRLRGGTERRQSRKMPMRNSTWESLFKLELELIQTNITQKLMLRVEVGAVSCSGCVCVAHEGQARENRGAWASEACKALGCVCPCVRLKEI